MPDETRGVGARQARPDLQRAGSFTINPFTEMTCVSLVGFSSGHDAGVPLLVIWRDWAVFSADSVFPEVFVKSAHDEGR